jgi:hypothetical protein
MAVLARTGALSSDESAVIFDAVARRVVARVTLLGLALLVLALLRRDAVLPAMYLLLTTRQK